MSRPCGSDEGKKGRGYAYLGVFLGSIVGCDK